MLKPLNLSRVCLLPSEWHVCYQSLQHICRFLLLRSKYHAFISKVDQYNSLQDVQVAQVSLDSILTEGGRVKTGPGQV